MKKFSRIPLLLLAVLILSSCSKEASNPGQSKAVELEGLLQKRDLVLTTFQYGEYFIDTTALRSEAIDLELYVGEFVTIRGSRIEGYPLSGGPVYVEVEEVLLVGLSPGAE